MDDDAPGLSVGFTVDTGDSFSGVAQLRSVMESAEGQIMRNAANIERATSGMVNVASATSNVVAFGNEATRAAQKMKAEAAQIERSGEAYVRQLERQRAAHGKTREELRAQKAEEKALAAERVGNTDLAQRLRAAEQAIWDQEFAAARRARAEAEAVAQEKEAAAARAVAAAEREAQAIRSAAVAYGQFEAAARRGMAVWREQQAAEAAAARDAQALAAAAERLRASIDPAYAAQQRFNREMAGARQLISAGAISLDDYVAKLRMEQAALDAVGNAHVKSTVGMAASTTSANANRQAMAGASYQVQDFFTQVSMGANPINAFAVQGAQLAGQFSTIEGTAGNVARFFMGPWGLAITAGLLVLSPMLGKLLETNDALGEAIRKLKEDAEAARIAEEAKRRFAQTLPGLTQAIHDQNEALKKSQEESVGVTERANAEAKARAALALRVREQTVALLEQARAQLAVLSTPGASDARLAPARDEAAAAVAKLEATLAEAKGRVAEAKEAVDRTRVDLATEATKRAVDPIERIKYAYEGPNGLIVQAKREALAHGDVNKALTRRLTLLAQQEAAEIAAVQRQQAAAKRVANDNQSGRQIGLSEAQSIVRSIGGVITSTTRTFEQQRVLYERYLAGRGPLAAKPGTSDHETGNALDIAKTPGITAGRIREAFRAQGVAVKQLLDEGKHFHVSWAKGANDSAAASKKLADTQQDLARKFDPAQAAAKEYETTLKAIAAAKLDPATAARYAEGARQAFVKARAAAFELPSMADVGADQAAADASAKAKAEFQANVIKPLQDELSLYGLVGPARDAAALALEKQAFIARNMGEGLDVALARWKEYYDAKKALIDKDAAAQAQADAADRARENLNALVAAADRAGDAMARAFGRGGSAIGDALSILARFQEQRAVIAADKTMLADDKAVATSRLQLQTTTSLIGATKNLFNERSRGYQAMAAAEKALTLIQLARTAVDVAGGAARMFATMGPAGFVAVGAMLAVMAGLGFSGGSGSSSSLPKSNTGTGTVLGDQSAKSESIKRAIDELKAVDLLTNVYSRQMAASLKSIDDQIGGVAAQIVRAGDVNASAGVTEGFKSSATKAMAGIGFAIAGPIGAAIGAVLTKIPVIGGIISGLFGSTTTVTGSGLFAGPQSVGSILGSGFDASYYSDIEKKSKFLGIKTGTKNSTQYANADAGLENQFTLLLKSFSDAIGAAAGPLGIATDDIAARVNGFVVNLGKIDTKGLTGAEISEKLSAVFGAAADGMAAAAVPGIERWQKVGEGAFETLVRVASTVESVSTSLDLLGTAARALGIDAKLGLADQFDSLGDLSSAVDAYFQAYYTKEEQAAAKTAQLTRVMGSLGFSLPTSIAGFRQLVEAQDLTTAAGQAAYATLLQLAPAFADLQSAMEGAKSAADIAAERQDLQRQMLELQGNTAAIRAMQLAKLDASNRALQEQIWAIQDAQEAAKAADELRQAWKSVGDSIEDEIRRIRGLTTAGTGAGFAGLQGQFNAATEAARRGDQDAAKSLPALSQALLTAAGQVATSRQELMRVQAQTAASLEATNASITKLAGNPTTSGTSANAMVAAAGTAGAATPPNAANDQRSEEAEMLRTELAEMKEALVGALAAVAGPVTRMDKRLDAVTQDSGGNAISTRAAAA